MKTRIYLSLFFIFSISSAACAQRTINEILDSTSMRSLLFISKKYGELSFSGYMQPQFQYAQSNGTKADYQGGSFSENTNNRFRLRRGRIRVDYDLKNDDQTPSTYFVFQFDGSEQGVNVRDFWGRYYEHNWQLFYFTVGIQGRPFGSELQISSGIRESPERGRMSQILMKTERDLGFAITLNPRKKGSKLHNLVLDAGVYNGQGLAGPAEFDNSKDFIFRLSHKPYAFKKLPIILSGGISTLQGGLNHQTNTKYSMQKINTVWQMVKQTDPAYIQTVAPRKYYGADIQISTKNKTWESELRAEFIKGLQTATAHTSATPGSYPVDQNNNKQPYYTRPFSGAYLTFIQTLNSNNQLILKYDYYDPNTKVSKTNVDPNNGFTAADIRFDTFGIGFIRIFNKHLKALVYYDIIKNENTLIKDYQTDQKDNILTIRTHFMF